MPTIPAALAFPGSASPVIILQYFHYKKIAMKNLERLQRSNLQPFHVVSMPN